MENLTRVALVTGASGGMGKAICEKFINEGYDLAYSDLNGDIFEGVSVPFEGQKIKFFKSDISDNKSVKELVKSVYIEFGKIDAVVQAAGGAPIGPLLEVEDLDWNKAWNTKFMGSIRLLREVSRKLIDNKQTSSFVVISGAFSKEPNELNVVNSALNSALSNVSKAISTDLARFNIRINVLNPGATATSLWDQNCIDLSKLLNLSSEEVNDMIIDSIPLKRLAQPKDIANAVYFLTSSESKYITGTQLTIDGGFTHSI